MTMNFDELLKEEISGYEDRSWTGKIGSTDVTLTAKPLTPADLQFVERKFRGFMSSPTPEGMIALIVRKAQSQGSQAFVAGKHEVLLNRVHMNKIGEIFGALFGDQIVSDEGDDKFEARVGK